MRTVRTACVLCSLLMGLVCASVLDNGTVSATTGPSNTTPVPALYKVPHRVAVLYPGQYALKSAARGARLNQGQMVIDLNTLGYLQGTASFRGYDAHGFQTSWVATLYNFHLTAPNKMTVDILGPFGTTALGKMYLQRTKQGDLVGQIALPKTRYAIQFHRNLAL